MSYPSPANPARKWLELSLAQQSVWLDAKLSGASSVYQLGGWARMSTPPDEQAIRQSVRLLMARHDALRLRIDDELPRQWLDESGEAPVTTVDLGDVPDPDAAFARHVDQTFAQPFSLGDRPLFEIQLVRTAGPTFLLWRFHHLIADSAAVSITLAHWFNAYDALTAAEQRELAPPSSYLKVVDADAAYLRSAAHHQDLAYWSDRFDPLPPQLIADLEARPSGATGVPVADCSITGPAFERFKSAADEIGVPVNRALFALATIALGRRYGQSDLVAGIALHRRDLSNLHVVGMLAGVVAVRWAFEPDAALADAVLSFGEQVDADLRHQRMPVDVLSRSLGLAGTGRAGLFEVAMSYLPADRGSAAPLPPGVTMGTVNAREASPISLHAAELPDGTGLTVHVAVNTDFLAPAEADSLAALLRIAVERFSEDLDAPCADLPAITGDEREAVLNRWSGPSSSFPVGTLDGLFGAQAAATPSAVAVVDVDGAELTYGELAARSASLARRLAAAGVSAGSVVGVRFGRSADTVVAILGILRAGGVYLPLDPAYPDDRLDYMAADAGATRVLRSLDDLPATEADVARVADVSAVAYVIYTSGTTGRPKGVAVPHGAAVNLAFARRACHDPLGPGDRVLAGISVGFDVSVGQLLLPLLGGATVVVAPDLRTLGAEGFWRLLAGRGVTHVNSVPSFVESVLPAARPCALRRLMLGGEPLAGSLVARARAAVPGLAVVNMYGPTEACIDATYHVATDADLNLPVLPIGRPLTNYRAYVLDGQLNPVGVGVSGELHLGGAGLADGYVNAAGLTAERFVANPFGPGRLYKTGDRARWRADGAIEFLGRVDQQVKVRGFRVEPAEIEAVILQHAGIAQAVVVPLSPKPGAAARLVAYVVPRRVDVVPSADELRGLLSERLPEYMVPSAFVPIAEIPINRNGKLDVHALPAPDAPDGVHVAPRTPTEATVATLFAEVLGLDQCGATDHFFELGGHSLLATTLVSKLHALGMAIPLRAVFETPTVEMLARRIDASLPSVAVDAGIPRQPRDDGLPLSYPQERIWFVDRLQQDSSYNIPIAFELVGQLDADAVEQAVRQIVDRHEALRTRIVLRDGRPVQIVDDQPEFTFRRADLRSHTGPDSAVRGHVDQLVRHRFDLSVDLPFQMMLLKLADDRHVLAAVVHHVAFDGWSAALFLQEFGTLYAGGTALPPLAVQPADFAVWQRGRDWSDDRGFWLDTLRGAPARLELPTTGTGAAGTRASGTLPVRFDADLLGRLQRLANEAGASLFMVVHAAFSLLMSRLSGQDDVVIGTVTANRNRPELEPLIGCFVNTLALRTTFKPGESFRGLLGRVKSADLAAYAHQDLPFEQLVEALSPDRSLEHTPVFQVMLVLQNAPEPRGDLPGLSLKPIAIEAEAAKFDLTLTLAEIDGALAGTIEYGRNRFGANDIARIGEQFERLLRAVAANPDVDASRVDLLSPEERRQVLDVWSGPSASFPVGTLDELFGAQALATPSAVAVVDVDGAELTYGELDARSASLARRLAAAGVSAGSVVGVRFARSADTVVAILGILRAGGVYLPLDPAYPDDRLDYMATDAGATRVLRSLGDLPDAEADVARVADPSAAAYVIYTSGTTGRPKGVAVPHGAAVNLAFARRACHDPLGPGDRVLAGISVGFDVSIGQQLLPLLGGATVVVAPDLRTLGAEGFWRLLAGRGVTHVNSVPSFVESVLPAAQPCALRQLMLGGEPLAGSLVARAKAAVPGLAVVNMYGPTEACIDATYHVATEADLALAVLPIGRPLTNYRAYVLDGQLNPVGVGVSGELYLGGAGLAIGYVNAAAMTAERFVANPFGAGRLYKTGDRARWRADGAIEFLGRVDQQVKVRGFRVEPAEIEAALRQVDGIREAAVIPEGATATGATRLIAYCVGDDVPSPESLRATLAGTLPDYMVPGAFVRLAELPLTPNGKLDRKALPAPDAASVTARPYAPPATDAERQTAELWAALLGVERVGRDDNFFELGGHSLMAVTLVERMRQAGLPVDVRALFTTPTIAGLLSATVVKAVDVPPNRIPADAERITPDMLPMVALSQTQLDRITGAVPGGASNVQDMYPLSPLQEGILFQHVLSADGDPYLTPFLLRFDRRERADAFIGALRRLVGRHDVLRTSMAWDGLEKPVQVVWRSAELPVEESSLDRVGLLRRYGPGSYRLDLSTAPLLRVVLARDGESDGWHVLMLTHHLVLDHTSLEVLVGELQVLMADPAAALPPTSSYRNYIAHTLAADRAEQEAFFRRMLGDVDETTAPFGLLDAQAAVDRTTESSLKLDAGLARRVRAQARATGVTPASLFHLAWAAVVGHAAARSDVVFGTVLFGRMHGGAGADRTVGMFINTLPIRVTLDGTAVADAVRRTQESLAGLNGHEHAALALAQRCSGVAAPAALFTSLFNYRYSPGDAAPADPAGFQFVGGSERTNYPLSMAVDDAGTGFTLTALGLPEAQPDRVCDQLQQAISDLLRLLETAPATAVDALDVLPPTERKQVVAEWNDTAQTFPIGTLDGLFAAQAARTPDAVAVVDVDGGTLTYAELDAQSAALASHLAGAGVRAGGVVGVRFARSADTVVAILGILRAGGTYLPLDPAYPDDRLAYMAGDAGAALVLEKMPALHQQPGRPVSADPAGTAYVIYTSGTTGRPKGVAVAHRAAVNLAFARRACHDPLGPGDRVLAAVSVGFDVSIGQLLLPLLSGATVVVAPDLRTLGGAGFWRLMVDRGVTHVNTVPSFVDSVLPDAPQPGALALRRLMVGGEPLAGALVARAKRVVPGLEVVNMYGPTEACIDATFHVATEADISSPVLPIGRPLSNYQTYVLDERLRPVGVGVEGELYLGGAGLADGYVNAAELTAERFVPNPFGAGRLYKTGDRSRWRADGALEFLGRVDQQVKVRGFRVEPAEIEAALRRVAGVREAAVVADGGGAGTRLIAYCAGDAVPLPEVLRTSLATTLPDYMVPAAFVRLELLPLTANGKLDRRALPKPAQGSVVARPFEPPVGEAEERMAAVWAVVLRVDRVGRHDNFFEMGGDSLGAMRMTQVLNAELGMNVPIRLLFQHPTVAGLATQLRSGDVGSRSRNLVPLQTGGTRPPLYTVHASSGHVFRYMSLVRALGPDQPVYGLQASGLEEGEPLGASVESMATAYVAAIRAVQPSGPYHLLGYSSGGLLAFEMAQQLRDAGETVGLIAILDTTLPDPRARRVPTPDQVVLDMASAMGIADLVGTRPPLPTLAGLVELARRAGRLPADFQTVHVERMADVFRNTVRTSPDYRMRDWDGHLLLVRASQRPRAAGPMVDWSPHVSGELDVVDVDCSHSNLIAPEMAPTVAAVVADRMRRSADRPPAGPRASGDRPVAAGGRGGLRRFASRLAGMNRREGGDR
jgi:amino acid adenylation domain-containing protein